MRIKFKDNSEELIFKIIEVVFEGHENDDLNIDDLVLRFSKWADQHIVGVKITISDRIELMLTKEFYDSLANYFQSLNYDIAEKIFVVATEDYLRETQGDNS